MYRHRTLEGADAGGIAAGAMTGAAAGATLGPIGAVVGAVVGAAAGFIQGAGASKKAKEAEDAYRKAVELAVLQAKRERMAAQATSYAGAAQTEQGNIIKWGLYGTGGVLLAGAGLLWLFSRKK